MSVFTKRQSAPEIPLMTRFLVRSYIMKIKNVKDSKYDTVLQAISSRRLNDKWEETEELCELLDDLTDDIVVGEIAEWILRQYFNRSECGTKKVQPPPYAFARRYVTEASLNERRRSAPKSPSLRVDMFRKMIQAKIENDPSGYAAAKEGMYIPFNSSDNVVSVQSVRPMKRKLVLVMKSSKKCL